MNGKFSWEKFNELPVVAIARNISAEDLSEVIPVFVQSGLTTLEITMNTPGASEMISAFSRDYAGTLHIGAGTVCTMQDLKQALVSGAQFIVTPIVDTQVISSCVSNHIPVFAGAFTPTEIFTAWKTGADMVKVFPATTLGPTYIKEIKAPLEHIKLMPTGGVRAENCVSFLQAGADALGMGGQLIDGALIRQKNWDGLLTHFGKTVTAVREFRKTIVAS